MSLFYTMLYPCDKVRDFMYDHLEGKLPTLTSIRFHLHLNGCPECREYLYLYRKAADAQAFRKENPPPDELLMSTLDFLKQEGIVGEDQSEDQSEDQGESQGGDEGAGDAGTVGGAGSVR